MLYPVIKRKNKVLLKGVEMTLLIIGCICILINELTTPSFKWSYLVILGMLYCFTTTMYSIQKNVNVASHVFMQVIAISILVTLLDYVIGFRGWSFLLAIPIAIVIGNMTMFILAMVARKRYFKYAIYQLVLSFLSGVFLLWTFLAHHYHIISLSIAFGISVFTLLITIFLCGRDLKEELQRSFHI